VNRAAAAGALLAAHPECQLIVSDDGLPALRLHRDMEIAVLDRRADERLPLPAGPLRDHRRACAQVMRW